MIQGVSTKEMVTNKGHKKLRRIMHETKISSTVDKGNLQKLYRVSKKTPKDIEQWSRDNSPPDVSIKFFEHFATEVCLDLIKNRQKMCIIFFTSLPYFVVF